MQSEQTAAKPRSVPGDLIFTFGDGDVYVTNKPDEVDKNVCENKHGLKKVEWVQEDGTSLDVGKTFKAHPEILNRKEEE
jgi:L-rhamnose isomerase